MELAIGFLIVAIVLIAAILYLWNENNRLNKQITAVIMEQHNAWKEFLVLRMDVDQVAQLVQTHNEQNYTNFKAQMERTETLAKNQTQRYDALVKVGEQDRAEIARISKQLTRLEEKEKGTSSTVPPGYKSTNGSRNRNKGNGNNQIAN